MKHLAIIPARGGSIGVKDKNLRVVGGTSLVTIAWNQCKATGFFDRIILSTDSELIANEVSSNVGFLDAQDEEIIQIDNNLGIHKRATKDAQTLSLISNLIFKLSSRLEFDFMWLIQPTSPFRYQEDFNKLKSLAETNQSWTSIVSLKDATEYHPDRMFRMSDNFVEPLLGVKSNDNSPRQTLPKVFIKDGAFYIFTKEHLSNKIFLGDKVLPFFREAKYNINIDTEEDLLIAQFLSDILRNEV